MPVLIAAILGGLASVMGSLVGRVLLALGLGYVTYRGLDALVLFGLQAVKDAVGGLSGEISDFFAYVWLDKAITMIFSSYSASMLIKGWSGGMLSKLGVKAPGS